MKHSQVLLSLLSILLLCALAAPAQQSVSQTSTQLAVVPHLMKFSGSVKDTNGKPLTGPAGVTFALYKEEQGGPALWLETQSVQLDTSGRYSVMLGSTTTDGLPADWFASGEARWLGVQPEGQAEQPRVLLVSVPYALKALDAETLGGKPASAFAAASTSGNGSSSSNSSQPALSGGGKKNYIPLWLSSSKLGSSKLFQDATGSIGLGTATPAANLDVNGTSDIRNTLTLFPNGSSPTLSVNGTAFNVSSTGLVNFVSGQTYPGAGTITGVTAGTDLTGGGKSGTVTLNVDTTKVVTGVTAGTGLTGGGTGGVLTLNVDTTKIPQLNAANAFNGNQTVTGNLSASGNISAAGSVSAATASLSANTGVFSTILNAYQAGSGTAVTGFSQSGTGVVGLTSSGSAAAVSGEGGTGVLGIGYTSSGGTGVSGTGTYGVQGTSSVSSGVGGIFNNSASGQSLSARINGVEVFGVYPGATLVNGGGLAVGANGITALIGDPGCGGGFAGIGFGNFAGCQNYALIGDGTNIYINRASGGTLHFREGNSEEMTIAPGGVVGIGNPFIVPGIGLQVQLPNGSAASLNGSGAGAAGVIANGGNGGSSDGGPGALFVGGSTSNGNAFAGDAIDSYAGDNTGNGTQSWAGYFEGNVGINGTLFKNGGSFKIDHPLDPANKYLYHSFVESPDMMNIYNGNVVTDSQGDAVVELPEWFETLNRDFRYQLTVIGQFAQAIVADEIAGNKFGIKTDKPNVKVSWQVTGIRQDVWANAHRIPVEEEKNARERGFYMHPELYGAPAEKGIAWARQPAVMKRIKDATRRQTDRSQVAK